MQIFLEHPVLRKLVQTAKNKIPFTSSTGCFGQPTSLSEEDVAVALAAVAAAAAAPLDRLVDVRQPPLDDAVAAYAVATLAGVDVGAAVDGVSQPRRVARALKRGDLDGGGGEEKEEVGKKKQESFENRETAR